MRPTIVAVLAAFSTSLALAAGTSSTPRPVPVKPAPGTVAFVATVGTVQGAPALSGCGSSVCSCSGIEILPANLTRRSFALQNVGASDVFVCLGSTCSSSAYQILLRPGERTAFPGPTLWGGSVSCASSGSSVAIASVASAPPPPPPPPTCDPDLCPQDPNGVAFCDAGGCGLTCLQGFNLVGGVCMGVGG